MQRGRRGGRPPGETMSESAEGRAGTEVKIYIGVFIALATLTVITVAITWFHLPIVWAVFAGLLVAVVKGSLVALFFMHLSHERAFVYGSLLLTVVFFFAVLLLPLFSDLDSTRAEQHMYIVPEPEATNANGH